MKKEKRLAERQGPEPGTYFFTICTYGHAKSLGCIVDGEMYISKLGSIVENTWKTIPELWPGWQVDICAIMPNHFHGILRFEPQDPDTPRPVGAREISLEKLVIQFKSSITKIAKSELKLSGKPVWQGNHTERSFQYEDDVEKVRAYVRSNPMAWHLDSENPNRSGLHPVYELLAP